MQITKPLNLETLKRHLNTKKSIVDKQTVHLYVCSVHYFHAVIGLVGIQTSISLSTIC